MLFEIKNETLIYIFILTPLCQLGRNTKWICFVISDRLHSPQSELANHSNAINEKHAYLLHLSLFATKNCNAENIQ